MLSYTIESVPTDTDKLFNYGTLIDNITSTFPLPSLAEGTILPASFLFPERVITKIEIRPN